MSADPDVPHTTPVFLAEPSDFQPDGLHFTVETRDLTRPAVCWERVERSWELPGPCATSEQAETVARTLALRWGGDRVFCVVDPRGKPARAFAVQQYLVGWEAGQAGAHVVRLPPGYEPPPLEEALREAAGDAVDHREGSVSR